MPTNCSINERHFQIIYQNYFWAWLYDSVIIPVASLGLMHPDIGSEAMAARSLNVVLNSLHLRKVSLDSGFKLQQ